MDVQVVKSQGMLRPGNIEPPTDSSLPARAQSTFESNSNLLNYTDIKLTSSSRDGWSTARVRAPNAEALTWREAAQREQDEEAAAWANVAFEPEPGATTKDIRIYTKLGGGEYRYWGVQDLDETMEEFWARIDPDNTRGRLANGILPAPAIPTSSKSASPRPNTASRSNGRRKAPTVNSKHRVEKPAIVTQGRQKGIRKALPNKIEGKVLGMYDQTQDLANGTTQEPTVATVSLGPSWPDKAGSSHPTNCVSNSTSKTTARGRVRQMHPEIVDSSPPDAADRRTSTTGNPPKFKRGRPAKQEQPTKSQRSHELSKKQRRPPAENKAKVTKSKLKMDRPTAPSIHKMRTRARGSAENIHIS